ncbi:uncharacterized protein LOC111707460 [Eurytemora carolleeae]|uniref:uncharacterized protein LOC111707460 n=1 Tax=Eurytemora carolleeae TaxID=1294199 RepID=UPI000C770362|nr:uncharacterized protein LOC111707460 [Eurytemora carolleeae]|eukprot:XP_023336339.1 uncharacterized protein LOC111707460 [Eurytemora affinis]
MLAVFSHSPLQYTYTVQCTQSSDWRIYKVALPDGRIQIVTYHADHIGGFVADVKYEGVPVYPEPAHHAAPYHAAPAPYAPRPIHHAPHHAGPAHFG